jgi:23S rRNA pseudouridine1911/1915/1917 synthase
LNTLLVKTPNRIDKALATELGYSRAKVQKMIQSGLVFVDEEIVKPSFEVKAGDVIEYDDLPDVDITLTPTKMDLDIVYQDEHIAVINKASGMVVHPAPGHYEHTLVHGLLYHLKDLSGINGEFRPGIVHRIDKDTSGLLVVAKNDHAHHHLQDQLSHKSMAREYLVLVHGVVDTNEGRIDAPIGRHPQHRLQMDVVASGKSSVTWFHVVERYPAHTLLRCKLETGRTHQIRVHLKYIGYPVVGDPLYGRKKDNTEYGQYLHATSLTLIHPSREESMTFTAPLPQEFEDKIKEINQQG